MRRHPFKSQLWVVCFRAKGNLLNARQPTLCRSIGRLSDCRPLKQTQLIFWVSLISSVASFRCNLPLWFRFLVWIGLKVPIICIFIRTFFILIGWARRETLGMHSKLALLPDSHNECLLFANACRADMRNSLKTQSHKSSNWPESSRVASPFFLRPLPWRFKFDWSM